MGYAVYYGGALKITPPLKQGDHEILIQIIDESRSDSAAHQIYRKMSKDCAQLFHFPLAVSEDGELLLSDSEEQREGLEDWLSGLIKHFFRPRGYSLDGEVQYSGDEECDRGTVYVKGNNVESVDDVTYNDGPSWSRSCYMSETVRNAVSDVVDSADETGCDGDVTVCNKSAVDALANILTPNQQQGNDAVASHGESEDRERPDNELSPSELSFKYDKVGQWGDHPQYTSAVWRGEVAQEATRRGYWDWVHCKLEENS